MGKKELEHARYMCEVHFRNSLYKDIKFKFMPSMGIKDVFQSFASKTEFIGVIHLNYRKGEDGKMYWHSSWLDRPEQAIEIAIQINDAQPYDEERLLHAVHDFIQSKYALIPKNILLN